MAVCSGSIKQFSLVVIAFFVAFLIVTSPSATAKLVEAKGISAVADNNIVEARKVALEKAKRAAVEQVVGTFVRSRTDVNNYLLGKDQIFSSTAGQIDEYKIIYDGVGDSEDIYEVVITADVRVVVVHVAPPAAAQPLGVLALEAGARRRLSALVVGVQADRQPP